MPQPSPEPAFRPPAEWELRPVLNGRNVFALLVLAIVLAWSGNNTEMGRMTRELARWAGNAVGLVESSQVGTGLSKLGDLFPMVFTERTPIDRIDGFDRDNLPWLARLETVEDRQPHLNPETLKVETVVTTREVLVQPLGYLWRATRYMLVSLQTALWGTVVAIVVSVVPAVWGARNYTPNRFAYALSRGGVGLLRSIPELISALFLVLAFGFGPVAGVLALGLHAAGFFGKFFAEDIENADKAPQEALAASGAGKLKVLYYGVLPQVLPQYVAYVLYILDRNVRMATVIGIVGAGGIGQELKGRFDMFDYGHVGTILLVMFVTVIALDQFSARLRAKLI
ncbi:MAG TPA: phosphonate ABC transporter, permease protein PhnE [Tepidisphaeraceae bacterium]|nr:phosphonate ABC transporter, permease protein PhnE [Tepidisphaeraceae bacterium]